MSTAQIRPSRVWYWVGGLLAILGLTAAGIWIGLAVKDMVDRTDDLQRVSLPGTGRVTFDDPGSYTVYVEAPGADDEEVDLPRGQVSMEPVDGGEPIEFEEYDGTFTYNWGGHEGRAVLTFEITEPGTYRVETETESGQPEGDVALGESLIGDLPRHVVLALVVGLLSLVGAAILITVTAVRRSRARRALAPPGSPGYRPPPGQYLPHQPAPPQPPGYPPSPPAPQPQYPPPPPPPPPPQPYPSWPPPGGPPPPAPGAPPPPA